MEKKFLPEPNPAQEGLKRNFITRFEREQLLPEPNPAQEGLKLKDEVKIYSDVFPSRT